MIIKFLFINEYWDFFLSLFSSLSIFDEIMWVGATVFVYCVNCGVVCEGCGGLVSDFLGCIFETCVSDGP